MYRYSIRSLRTHRGLPHQQLGAKCVSKEAVVMRSAICNSWRQLTDLYGIEGNIDQITP